MAELIVQLRNNPSSGKKDVIIKLISDLDALPHEHEEHHRQIVDQLLAGGTLTRESLGEVWVERMPDGSLVETETQEERQAEALKQ